MNLHWRFWLDSRWTMLLWRLGYRRGWLRCDQMEQRYGLPPSPQTQHKLFQNPFRPGSRTHQ